MLQSNKLDQELPQNIIRGIGSNPAIEMVVDQEMHSPETGKLHTINLLSLVLFTHQFNELLSCE